MGKLFDLESPLFSFLNKFADLIYLNILTMICCIPIITIGASMTALNYVVLKMVRNEEGYITRAFFRSFKQNFKQATLIWLVLLVIVGILAGDAFILNYSTVAFPSWFRTALAVVAFIMIFATMHVFPVLAKFENSIKHTFKNSLFMGILSLPKNDSDDGMLGSSGCHTDFLFPGVSHCICVGNIRTRFCVCPSL